MMKSANIKGNFMNHSLCSTATTRLFHASIDEQLIMSRTGHSSSNGVRAYKCICDQQQQQTSVILNKKRERKENSIDDENCSTIANVQVEQRNSEVNVNQSKLKFTSNVSSSNVTFNIKYIQY